MKAGDRYKTSKKEEQDTILPNSKGITDLVAIQKEEAKGFIKANIILTTELNETTKFDLDYIFRIHKLSLAHIYEFAGELRNVDMSKGGFAFPSALHLAKSMNDFEEGILKGLKNRYETKEQLINDIARVHAELLFIHPFREGNGRTARILANLMCHKAGYESLSFEKLDTPEMFENYVVAVQQAGFLNYKPMIKLIEFLFED